MNAVGIIPVRLESSRLSNKAILDICGLPMFVHTCKRALLAKTLDEVFLATDNKIISEIANKHNIKVIMTSTTHKNSTERIAEACEKIDCDIIVNIQGDEPLLYPEHIDKIVSPMLIDSTIQVSIGITTFSKNNSPSDIKAVFDLNQDILFFSRNDIPLNYKKHIMDFWKLVFIVPHRKKWVQKYLVWEQTPLELIEDNHFLRLVEHGVKIKAVEVNGAKISVDTQEDLNDVRALMEIDKLKNNYL
jgi:3-deoxy-manno-octulosonate cytidylyltransferase (CMP-KDO synthetase)